jgi:hypothetical protein
MTPSEAWAAVKGQFQSELPASIYNRYIEETDFRFEDDTLLLICKDLATCQGLQSLLASKIQRLFTAFVGKTVVLKYDLLPAVEPHQDIGEQLQITLTELHVEPIALGDYHARVKPEQIVAIPGYFKRYLASMSPEVAWLYVSFRQMAYLSGFKEKKTATFSMTGKNIATFAGMSYSAFKRRFSDPMTWKMLRWLVVPQEGKGQTRWKKDEKGRPHRSPHTFWVRMDLPLILADQKSLHAWLEWSYANSGDFAETLQRALATPVKELLAAHCRPNSDFDGTPKSVEDVVMELCPEDLCTSTEIRSLGKQLLHHIMPPNDLIIIRHYFIKEWVPRLSAAQAWMITLLRDLCFWDPQTGETRDEINIQGGYAEIADWLGINRIRTFRDWLRDEKVRLFVKEYDQEYGIGNWETCPRRLRVILEEPDPGYIVAIEPNRMPETVLPMDANEQCSLDIPVSETSYSPSEEGSMDTTEPNRWSSKSQIIDASEPNRWTPMGYTMDTSELFYRRARACNNLLNTKLQQIINSGSPPAPLQVVTRWQWETLFENCMVEDEVRKKLKMRNISCLKFVSWLLYATSPRGARIKDPVGLAISKLSKYPGKGAGGGYDKLSQRVPEELLSLIQNELLYKSPRDRDWMLSMAGSEHTKLITLLGYLAPKSADAIRIKRKEIIGEFP